MAVDRIVYGEESYYIENGDDRIDLKKSTCQTLYWCTMDQVELNLPWKLKWEQQFENVDINWELAWSNVHNSMLQYKVQSKLWELMNLNFISSM